LYRRLGGPQTRLLFRIHKIKCILSFLRSEVFKFKILPTSFRSLLPFVECFMYSVLTFVSYCPSLPRLYFLRFPSSIAFFSGVKVKVKLSLCFNWAPR